LPSFATRELGFEVDAIRALHSLQDDPDQSCARADEIAQARLFEVEKRIASLNALRTELREMISNVPADEWANVASSKRSPIAVLYTGL
jgi:DNA-binding transcriptional MerR regulator